LLRLAKLSALLRQAEQLCLVLLQHQVKLNVLSRHRAMQCSVPSQHPALVSARQTGAAHLIYQRLLRLVKLSVLSHHLAALHSALLQPRVRLSVLSLVLVRRI
jgi:hypothetical protein